VITVNIVEELAWELERIGEKIAWKVDRGADKVEEWAVFTSIGVGDFVTQA
jgi:hypothetical protein